MIVAVDPGSKGALAWSATHSASEISVLTLADHDVAQIFLRFQSVSHFTNEGDTRVAFLEENTGFIAGSPRTGSSMWKFGVATGRVEMALAALGFEIRRVRPRRWQEGIGAPRKRSGESSAAWKGRLATFAREVTPSLYSRITRDNADAVLILRYGIKLLDNEAKQPILRVEQPNTIIHDHTE